MTASPPTDHERLRPPAVAGLFYPEDPRQLELLVRRYIEQAGRSGGDGDEAGGAWPKAIIAPHAGYPYSGPVAGAAYAALRPARGQVRRVVLIGPAHRVRFGGLAVSSAKAFATPLAEVPVDRDAVEALIELPYVHTDDKAHDPEHGLEVHLPFLLHVLGEGFAIVPLLVGDASYEQVAEVLDRLWGRSETLIVVSSDLSHYQDHATATHIDRATAEAIVAGDPSRVGPYQACGSTAIQGLLHLASQRGLHGQVLDLRNSGDTAGPRHQVVGYGAFAFR